MIIINRDVSIPDAEVELHAIRSQGAGGQNVNKVSSAIHLRFNIGSSSLPFEVKERLLKLADQRINGDGVLVIKAQVHRTQEKNKVDALKRLTELIRAAACIPKKRVPTKPKYSAVKKRLETKNQRGRTKSLRKKPDRND